MSDKNSVAVVGAGAVGGYFASQAWVAGNSLNICERTAFDQLVVESGGQTIEVDAPVYTDPADVGVHDWVFVATKTHDTAAAAPWLASLCGPDTVILVIQNGVEHVERMTPFAGPASILPAIARYGGEAIAPGHIRHYTYGNLFVPDDPSGQRLVELFRGSNVEVTPTARFSAEAWGKLVTNVAANAIPALTQQRFPVLRIPAVADLARGLMRECVAVAGAEGIVLSDSLPASEVERMAGLPDHVGSSMLYDRLAGRTLEYDALNGAVVRGGERHGVPTPLNQAMVALLSAISAAAGK